MNRSLVIINMLLTFSTVFGMNCHNVDKSNHSNVNLRRIIHRNDRPYKCLEKYYRKLIRKENIKRKSTIDPQIWAKIDAFVKKATRRKYSKNQIRNALYAYICYPKSSVKEIAAFHYLPESALEFWIWESKISSRRPVKNRTRQQDEDAIRYYSEGLRIREIQEKCNLPQHTLHKRLNRENVVLRKRIQEQNSQEIMQKIADIFRANPDISDRDLAEKLQMSERRARYYTRKALNDGIIQQPDSTSASAKEDVIEDYKKGWWTPKGLAKKHSLSEKVVKSIIHEAKTEGIRVRLEKNKDKISRRNRILSLNDQVKIERDYLSGELTHEGICELNNIGHGTLGRIISSIGRTRTGSSSNVNNAISYLWRLTASRDTKLTTTEYNQICSDFFVKKGTVSEGITVINDWKGMSQSQKEILLKIVDKNNHFDEEEFFSSLEAYDSGTNVPKYEREKHRINEDFKRYAFLLSKSTSPSLTEKFGLEKKNKMKYVEGKARKLRVVIEEELKNNPLH